MSQNDKPLFKYWQYRVVKYNGGSENEFYKAHEVYFGEDDRPVARCTDGATIGSETPSGLAGALSMMLKALARPVIDESVFPNEV